MTPRELFAYTIIFIGQLVIWTNLNAISITIGGTMGGIGVVILYSKPKS